MKQAILVLAAFIVLILVFRQDPVTEGGRAKAVAPMQACPPGYAPSPTNSTWAGWSYNCLPVGVDSSLVGVPSDTYTRPMTTIYAPIVSNTGCAQQPGAPAKTLEYPSQDLRSLFPRYK